LTKALNYQNSLTQNQIQLLLIQEQAQSFQPQKDLYNGSNLAKMKKQLQDQLIDMNNLPLIGKSARSFKEIAEALMSQLEFLSKSGLFFAKSLWNNA